MAPATTVGLVLPELPVGIPVSLCARDAVRASARVAQLLIEACDRLGIDMIEDQEQALESACSAFNGWMAEQLGTLKILTPAFTLRPRMSQEHYYRRLEERAPCQFDSVEMIWQSRRIAALSVGERLEYLERAYKGLGATVLKALNRSSATFAILTPDSVLGLASYMYWGCEEDENSYIDQMAGDEDEREDMRSNIVTRKMVDDAFPAWAVGKKTKALSDKALKALETECENGFVRDVAASVRRLQKIKVPEFPLDPDGEFIDFAAVACWHENDLVLRVADDLINMAHQSEYCDISGEVGFALDAPDTFVEWLVSMKAFFASAGAVDHLLWLVAEADYGHGGNAS